MARAGVHPYLEKYEISLTNQTLIENYLNFAKLSQDPAAAWLQPPITYPLQPTGKYNTKIAMKDDLNLLVNGRQPKIL